MRMVFGQWVFIVVCAVLDPDINIVVFLESGRLEPLEEFDRGGILLEFENYGLFDCAYFLELSRRFVVGFVDFKIVAGFPLGSDVNIEKRIRMKMKNARNGLFIFIYLIG